MNNKLLPLLFVLGIYTAHSQVGIGTKKADTSAELHVYAENGDKGVLIPSVKLLSTTDTTTIRNTAESLLVFNTNTIADITPGYYYWLDRKWNRLSISDELAGQKGDKGDIGATGAQGPIGLTGTQGLQGLKGDKGDPGAQGIAGIGGKTVQGTNITITGAGTDANPYTVNAIIPQQGDNLGNHTATTDLAMAAKNINNVGNLDVKGTSTLANKVYVKTTAIAPANGVSQLAVDNSTGEIYKVGSSTDAGAKPVSYVTYTISNVNGDWISDYNTKIPADKYTVVVVGYTFSTTLTLFYNSVPPVNVISFVYNGNWFLTADYKNSGTSDGSNGTWTINCLVLNNSLTNVLTPQTANLNGGTGGSAISLPAGL